MRFLTGLAAGALALAAAASSQAAIVFNVSNATTLSPGTFQVDFTVTSTEALEVQSIDIKTTAMPPASAYKLTGTSLISTIDGSDDIGPGGAFSNTSNPALNGFVVNQINVVASAPGQDYALVPVGVPTVLASYTFTTSADVPLATNTVIDVTAVELGLSDFSARSIEAGDITANDGSIVVVPEPASLGLLGLAGVGLLARRRRAMVA